MNILRGLWFRVNLAIICLWSKSIISARSTSWLHLMNYELIKNSPATHVVTKKSVHRVCSSHESYATIVNKRKLVFSWDQRSGLRVRFGNKKFSVGLVDHLFQPASNQVETVEKLFAWLSHVIVAPVRDSWAGLFKARLSQPRINENFDFIFVAFHQGVLFIFFALQFWARVISNYTKHKRWITLLYTKKCYLS